MGITNRRPRDQFARIVDQDWNILDIQKHASKPVNNADSIGDRLVACINELTGMRVANGKGRPEITITEAHATMMVAYFARFLKRDNLYRASSLLQVCTQWTAKASYEDDQDQAELQDIPLMRGAPDSLVGITVAFSACEQDSVMANLMNVIPNIRLVELGRRLSELREMNESEAEDFRDYVAQARKLKNTKGLTTVYSVKKMLLRVLRAFRACSAVIQSRLTVNGSFQGYSVSFLALIGAARLDI